VNKHVISKSGKVMKGLKIGTQRRTVSLYDRLGSNEECKDVAIAEADEAL
jgi:hypothetical protein